MKKTIAPEDFEEIDRLVRAEVEEALAHFRAGDFERRVRRRALAEAGPARGIGPLAKFAIPAAAVLVLVVLASVLFFSPSRPPLRIPIEPADFTAVLSLLPAFSAPSPETSPQPSGEADLSPAGRMFTKVFSTIGEGWRAEPVAVESDLRRAAPLTMKERMKILFKDRVIERVFVSRAPKSKEV
jgi:hypothetical protein